MALFNEAIVEYICAIKNRPDYVEAYCNLGIAYFRKAQYDKAIDNCLHAIQLQPGNAYAYRWLGIIYMKEGLKKEANDAFVKSGIYYNGDKINTNIAK